MPGLSPLLRNKYQAIWEFAQGLPQVETTPPNLQIAKNNTCNFQCVYCRDHRPGNDYPRYQTSPENWRMLLELVPRTEVISFFGISEVFIDPEFFDWLELAGHEEATLTLNTNGSVYSPRHAQALRDFPGRLNLIFSLDAASPEVFQRLRGADFAAVVTNIRRYAKALAGRRNRTYLALSFVVCRTSLPDMLPAVYLARALEVDVLKFLLLHEYSGLDWRAPTKDGGTFDYRQECISNLPIEFNRERERVRAAGELLDVAVELPAAIPETGPTTIP